MANRYQLSGDLAGTVSGDTVTLRSTALDWTTSEAPYQLCHYDWTGTVAGSRITGTYHSIDCAEANIQGTFDVSKGTTTELLPERTDERLAHYAEWCSAAEVAHQRCFAAKQILINSKGWLMTNLDWWGARGADADRARRSTAEPGVGAQQGWRRGRNRRKAVPDIGAEIVLMVDGGLRKTRLFRSHEQGNWSARLRHAGDV